MAYVLALLLLAIFSTLALAITTQVTLGLRQSSNCRDALGARLVAESGLTFATYQMQGIMVEGPTEPEVTQIVYNHLAARLDGTDNLGGQPVTLDGDVVTVPAIAIPESSGSFQFTVTKLSDGKCRLVVVGTSNGYSRRVAVDYDIVVDTTVLTYAVASRSRVIITDGAKVDGDICSMWDRTRISGYDIPPFLMEPDTRVVGNLKINLSQEEFDEYNSGDYLDGNYEGIDYNEPEFGEYKTDDFDTSSYKEELTDINDVMPPDYWANDDPFPAPDNIRRRIDRPVYENRTFEDVYIPVGHNPKFINCTFNRIIYIDTNEAKTLDEWSHYYYSEHAIPGEEDRSADQYNDHSNNVVFEDCKFNGPVITAVPRDYWWSKNALTFEGETTFTNTHMPESTILAPNFGVDIGGRGYDSESNPESKLTGVIVGGIVDVRGTANIEGTILSMYYPDTDRGSAARYYGTNIGFYDDGGETSGATGFPGDIRIIPQPDNQLPFGIRNKYTIKPTQGTYVELTGQ